MPFTTRRIPQQTAVVEEGSEVPVKKTRARKAVTKKSRGAKKSSKKASKKSSKKKTE